MSHLFKSERVTCICTCGLLKSITSLYFCRHCLVLRCSNCVSHEVDTHYCPHCLENLPVNEARLKKNRCATCFDCPSCQHTLSTRAATIQIPNPEESGSLVSKKVYYLGCTNCRWTSRDVGLEDQIIATSGWPEKENSHSKKILELMEHYRAIGQREKFEVDRKKSTRKKVSYLNVTEKYMSSSSFSSLGSRRSLISSPYQSKLESTLSMEKFASVASEDVTGLPPDIFTEEIDLTKICTIEQRLQSPEFQPVGVKECHPPHKSLIVKCSHRCRQCEHNLSKPEFNPSSIKFKIQLGAYYHVPEIRIVREVELKENQTTVVQLSLCNPTSHEMTVSLLPFSPEDQLSPRVEDPPQSISSLGSMSKIVDLPKERNQFDLTANVVLPKGTMILTGRDDTAEYDELDSSAVAKDEFGIVVWRRSNKVGFNVDVTPKPGSKEAVFALVLNYDYTNTVAASNESRTVNINIPVVINAGTLS